MDDLQSFISEYTTQLHKGTIQKAYQGIITFMSGLKTHLEKTYPNYITGGLYLGYMDMTYFPFTPPELKVLNLKIAIVYVHEAGRFEAWLGGGNRKVQSEFIERLSLKNIGHYQLSKVNPGVDSIIETILVDQPNFNDLDKLKEIIGKKSIDFINDMILYLKL